MKSYLISVVFLLLSASNTTFAMTDNLDGTLTDETTGLMWTKSSYVSKTWNDACNICSAAETGGYTDWRIPQIYELTTTVDHETGQMDHSFAINASNFWSKNEDHKNGFYAWSFNKTGMVVLAQKTESGRHALCVRGDVLTTSTLFDVSEGLVHDPRTGLTWQQADDEIVRDFPSAVAYCEDLEFAGRDDWYLPSVEELSSILLYRTGANLKIDDTVFDPTSQFNNRHFNFWSSTVYQSGNYAYRISFQDGTVVRTDKINKYFTRCVCEENTDTQEPVEDVCPDLNTLLQENGLYSHVSGFIHAYPNYISKRTYNEAKKLSMESAKESFNLEASNLRKEYDQAAARAKNKQEVKNLKQKLYRERSALKNAYKQNVAICLVTINLTGSVTDILSEISDHNNDFSARILIGENVIVLRDQDVNLLSPEGTFDLATNIEILPGEVIYITLYVSNWEGDESVIDSTKIEAEQWNTKAIVGGVFRVTNNQEEIIVTSLGKNASHQHSLYAVVNSEERYLFDSDEEGMSVNLGMFDRGTKIIFKLENKTSGNSYYTGKKHRNPDKVIHAKVEPMEGIDGWQFGFEDVYGGGDQDYNDCMFAINGVVGDVDN